MKGGRRGGTSLPADCPVDCEAAERSEAGGGSLPQTVYLVCIA